MTQHQAEAAMLAAADASFAGIKRGQVIGSKDKIGFPSQYLPQPRVPDMVKAVATVKAFQKEYSDQLGKENVQPQFLITPTEADVAQLQERQRQMEIMCFDSWIEQTYDTSDPTTRNWLMGIYPQFYQNKVAYLEQTMQEQLKVGKRLITGPQDLPALMELYEAAHNPEYWQRLEEGFAGRKKTADEKIQFKSGIYTDQTVKKYMQTFTMQAQPGAGDGAMQETTVPAGIWDRMKGRVNTLPEMRSWLENSSAVDKTLLPKYDADWVAMGHEAKDRPEQWAYTRKERPAAATTEATTAAIASQPVVPMYLGTEIEQARLSALQLRQAILSQQMEPSNVAGEIEKIVSLIEGAKKE